MAGAVRMLPVASAPAPAAVFRNVRRSMILPTPALNQIFRDVSPSPQRSVSDSVECLPAAGTPPPTKLAGFRHIPLAARHIYLLPPCRLSEKSLPKSRSTHRSKKPLFDHLVGADEQCGRQVEAECPRSFEIDDELQFGRKLDREVGHKGALQYLVNISRGATEAVIKINSIANEAA